MKKFAIRAMSISKSFGRLKALNNVDFELEQGEILCLAGENGCGKSMLIKVINGVYAPEQGAEFQFGEDEPITSISPAKAKSKGIHVIWQDLSLFPDLSVGENITYDEFIAHPFTLKKPEKALERATKTLHELGVDLNLNERLGNLSIAQRQLVAICRVLQADASIIFMDEPTASLTRIETDNLLSIIRRLSKKGISIVFVSHRLSEALDVCSRVMVLRDGKFVGVFSTKGMTQKKLSKLMTGQDIEEQQRNISKFGDIVLELKELSKDGQFEDISLALRSGEILGLTGLLGSGRTELSLAIYGMTKPDKGSMYIDGNELSFRNAGDAIKQGIAYVSEDRLNLGLHQTQSIVKNTGITTLAGLSSPSFYLNPRSIWQLCEYWIKCLKTKVSDPSLPVNSLSGGNQQRIVLAKWLATNPKILILDSPTVGVDVGAKSEIFKIIRDLADKGMAIILISDEANEIYTHTDRMCVMREGKIVHEVRPKDILEEELERMVNA